MLLKPPKMRVTSRMSGAVSGVNVVARHLQDFGVICDR